MKLKLFSQFRTGIKNQSIKLEDSAIFNKAIGLGTANDKVQTTSYHPSKKTDSDVYHLYQYNGLAYRIVENLVGDSTRKWRHVESSNQRLVDLINAEEKRLHLADLCANVSRELYIYGVCYVMLYTNNSETLNSPLMATEQIQKAFILPRTYVTESGEKVAEFNEFFNTPLYYTVSTSKGGTSQNITKIHYTRIIKLTDRYKSPADVNHNEYIGTLNTVYQDVIGYCSIMNDVQTLINDSSIPVLQSEGLKQLLAQADGRHKVDNYFAAAMRDKSIYRTTIIDANDVLSRLEVGNLSSIKDVIEKYMESICASTNQSIKRLFGLQAKGMSSDNNSEDGWISYLEGWQSGKYDVMLKRIENQILAFNKIAGEYEVIWNPIEVQSETEQAESLSKLSDSLTKLVASTIILPSRAAAVLNNSGYIEIPDDEIEAVKMNEMTEGQLNGNNNSVSEASQSTVLQ